MKLRTLDQTYTFDHRIADCEQCPLNGVREQTICLSARPVEFNGLMIVGEGPGPTEALEKVPFIGSSGDLLTKILTQTGIDRGHTYISNATLCLPPRGEKEKKEALGSAVQRCRSRLFTEIHHLQPRVIVALGDYALASLCGEETEHNKRVPYECYTCGGERKWKRWGCSRCKHIFPDMAVRGDRKPEASPCGLSPEACTFDGVKRKEARWQPRMVKCPECRGYKTQVVTTFDFRSEYKITEVAGGVFRASELDICHLLETPEDTFVVPSYHPSALLRPVATKAQKKIGGQFLAAASLRHFEKARRLVGDDQQWRFDWERIDDPEMIRAHLTQPGVEWAVDIETDHKEVDKVTQIKCIGFAALGSSNAFVVDTENLPGDHPRVEAVVEVLVDWRVPKGFHHGYGFDIPVIASIWQAELQGYAFDTMISHNAVAPDEPHSLAHVAFEFTDADVWKPPKEKGGLQVFRDAEELHRYNAKDARVTADAESYLRAEHAKEGVEAVVRIDMKKAVLAREMSRHGMFVDRKRQLQLAAEHQYKAEQALFEMRQIVGRIPVHVAPASKGVEDPFAFNPNSNRQLVWALYDPHGPCQLVPSRWTDNTCSNPSTDKNALLDHQNKSTFVQQLQKYRKHAYTKRALDGLVIGSDMRLHAQWNPIGARTGRYSSSPNVQNQDETLRSMIVAPEGRKIVGADKSQLELRILAALTGDAALVDKVVNAVEARKLEPDYDPHSYVAMMAFGTSYTALRLDDAKEKADRKHLRDVAKRVVYGLNYGAGAETIREAIYDGGYDGPEISIELIRTVVEAYFKAFPGVGPWRDEQLWHAQHRSRVYDAILGRYREFPLGDVDATICYNFPIQSTAASDMDIAMWNFHCELPRVDPSAFIFAQVHDAIYAECAADKAEATAVLLENHLNSEIQLIEGGPVVPLPATAKIADNWGEAA